MCKEDVRIKRKTATRTFGRTLAGGSLVPALPANPDRVALTVGINTTTLLTTSAGCVVGALDGSTFIPLLFINGYRYVGTVSLEDVGRVLTYPIVVNEVTAGGQGYAVTESFFAEPLEAL